jgi:transcriptional regulator with XRE-family HTH domain
MDEKDPVMEEIGTRVQLIRKKMGIMQKDFADELGISGASLSEIESGNAKPMFAVYYNLTSKYGVNMYYLLFGLGRMFVDGEPGNSSEFNVPAEYREFLEMFLKYFRESQVIRYAMMSHFETFLSTNENLIEKNIKNNKKK